MGWLTVLGYGIAAILALRTSKQVKSIDLPQVEKIFWFMLTPALFFLMVNKQLDLQSLLTAVGRCEAQISGWYDLRRAKQAKFIYILITTGLFSLVIASFLLRRSIRRMWLVLLGTTSLVTFILVRAVGFHHVDVLIGTTLAGWRVNWIFELGGIVLVIAGTLMAAIKYHHLTRPPHIPQ